MAAPKHLRFAMFLAYLVLTFAVNSHARTRTLMGRMFAYDPWSHRLKMASFVQNGEIIVLKLGHPKSAVFVKLVFTSFGLDQVEEKYFTGASVLTVRAKRSFDCDEHAPQFFGEGEALIPPQANDTSNVGSGVQEDKLIQKYRLTEAFPSKDIRNIHGLQCYRVETSRK